MKKILAVVLALMLVFSLGCTAFAAGVPNAEKPVIRRSQRRETGHLVQPSAVQQPDRRAGYGCSDLE